MADGGGHNQCALVPNILCVLAHLVVFLPGEYILMISINKISNPVEFKN